MRTVVHISDVHFGRLDDAVVEALVAFLRDLRPDVVAVSGDLTQRARSEEFRRARAFLDRLPSPQIVVPGNHDIPLHNLYARFVGRLKKFRTFISEDLEPTYADEEVAIIGVNTARSLTVKGGRINARQVARIREWLCPFAAEVTKIVVTHHPFDLPPERKPRLLVGRARMALESLAHCGADVFLSGHLHLASYGLTTVRYPIPGLSALVVQAGTATSTRGRGEANSFNLLRIDCPEIAVERILWDPDRAAFALVSVERFRHETDGWTRVPLAAGN